jgi:hypothetical protein
MIGGLEAHSRDSVENLWHGRFQKVLHPDIGDSPASEEPGQGRRSLPAQRTLDAVRSLPYSDRLRGQQVERARYEAELAQRRYMRVDPDNHLVADSLEAYWNQKLKLLADTQQECKQLRERDHSKRDFLAVLTARGFCEG